MGRLDGVPAVNVYVLWVQTVSLYEHIELVDKLHYAIWIIIGSDGQVEESVLCQPSTISGMCQFYYDHLQNVSKQVNLFPSDMNISCQTFTSMDSELIC